MRRLASAAVAVALVVGIAGCTTDAAKSKVFITTSGKVVLEPMPHHIGETILRIENDDAAKHRVVLIKLDSGVDPSSLPLVAGILPVGRPGDLEYRGQGYRVVEKLDTMRPFYGGDQRVISTVHTYLGPGHYVLLSDLPGDFGKGVWTAFTIGTPT